MSEYAAILACYGPRATWRWWECVLLGRLGLVSIGGLVFTSEAVSRAIANEEADCKIIERCLIWNNGVKLDGRILTSAFCPRGLHLVDVNQGVSQVGCCVTPSVMLQIIIITTYTSVTLRWLSIRSLLLLILIQSLEFSQGAHPAAFHRRSSKEGEESKEMWQNHQEVRS
jgi:hypothetical protein